MCNVFVHSVVPVHIITMLSVSSVYMKSQYPVYRRVCVSYAMILIHVISVQEHVVIVSVYQWCNGDRVGVIGVT